MNFGFFDGYHSIWLQGWKFYNHNYVKASIFLNANGEDFTRSYVDTKVSPAKLKTEKVLLKEIETKYIPRKLYQEKFLAHSDPTIRQFVKNLRSR